MSEGRYTIFACVEPDCDYYRDELSTGVHQFWEGTETPATCHKIQPVGVVPAAEAQAERASVLNEVVEALERGYHGQNPSRVHPADYITKAFQLDGHENLNVRVVEPDPREEARARLSEGEAE